MEIFFRKNIEGFLAAIAIVLIGVMVGCFVWGMSYISQSFDNVFEAAPTTGQMVNFNLAGARSLNLRGLVPQANVSQ
ncbi:MAG: hypothetical protein WCF77_03345 [Minisyncoccia bacterium]|jgi:hypothetical protein